MQVRFQPYGTVCDVPEGSTVLDAAEQMGIDMESVCGGRGTCGKCRVVISKGVSPPNELEREALSPEELAAGYRLACQAVVTGGTTVVIPEESLISRVSILSGGVDAETELVPWAYRQELDVPAATLDHPVSDAENVARAMGKDQAWQPSVNVLRGLPEALRADEGAITIVRVDHEVVDALPGHGHGAPLGMAFDIGTTTVVGYLLDLETGAEVGVSSLLNPQTRYGDDVVSRIEHAQGDGGLADLQDAVLGAINNIIGRVLDGAGPAYARRDIVAMTVVGNTTMQHLLLRVNPRYLAQAPYVPVFAQSKMVHARDLGIEIHPDAHVWMLPNIAGWVGADTVGVLLATGLYRDDQLGLAIDIGTNGEMAMGSRDRIVTCSTAAGPAFEGAHLSCGMRAADGAIDTVALNHDVEWHAIGGAAPRGVCGSGLVDLVAEMLRVGVIQETGMMSTPDAIRQNGHSALAQRIVGTGRSKAFEVVGPHEGAGGRPIHITQRDVRELQLAKGAIRAGVEILLHELGATHADVRRVYLAGAFGNYVRPESALRIGLIPRFPRAEIVPVGNAAGSGAKMALCSREVRDRADELTTWVEYIELSGRHDFQDEFAEAMLFGCRV